ADWDSLRKRRAIAGAFAEYGRRGTVAGLRQKLWSELGLLTSIQEPILQTSWWALPAEGATSASGDGNSVLGFTTMLAPVEPQGAVVGTSAVLDQSQLIEQDDSGAALFRDVANRFTVFLYRGHGDDEQSLAAVRALLDREKPAHTIYDLCVIQPRLRIGFQAQVGIDTVVGGAPFYPPGVGTVLGG